MAGKTSHLPAAGQIRCQGGQGHWWDPIPTPFGYRPTSWLCVHFRCPNCLTVRRIHVNRNGQVERREYFRDPSWISYARDEMPAKDDQRLLFFTSLGEEVCASKESPKKAAAQRKRKLRAVS